MSQSTVSIVLSGNWPGRISPATAQKVLDFSERLGYRPNLAARNLRLGRTRTVLLVVPELTAPFFGAVYTGAARTAAEHGFRMVIYQPPAEGSFTTPYEAIDGILVASSVDSRMVAELQPGKLPTVLLDSDPAGETSTVNFDLEAGMRAIVEHLTGLGHRRIGHLAAGLPEWTFHERASALTAALETPVSRVSTAIDVTAAREAALSLLTGPARPTALICDDDVIAAGAYKAARDAGLDVPADLSITGFDDVMLAELLYPELTTVRLPAEELGATSMSVLLDLLDGQPPRNPVLPCQLIIRGSTRAPSPR